MKFQIIIPALLSALLLSGCSGDDNDDDIRDLREEISALETQLGNASTDRAALLAQIEALELELAELDEEFEARKAIDLTILHMNDHHSHLEAETFDFDVSALSLETRNAADEQPAEVSVRFGGFPMLVSLFNQQDTQYANVAKVHAGDAVTGTLYYTLFAGEADAAMMNQVCFDVFALGNHEFDAGDQGLAHFLDDLNSTACETSVLAANVTPHAASAIATGYIQPYRIMEFEGESVGFIGIDIAGKTKNSSRPDDGTTFQDEIATSQTYIDELEALGVNKIVLVTHYQYSQDMALAQALTGVDVIVGGDSHSLLGGSTFSDLGFNPVGDYPTQVTNLDNEPVCIVHAWEYAHLLGKLDVSFDSQGMVTACSGSPIIPISSEFVYEYADDDNRVLSGTDAFAVRQALTSHPEVVIAQNDATTAGLLKNYEAETAVLTETVIGNTAEDLCLVRWPGDSRSTICDVADTYAMGSDISNIVAKAFMEVTPTADIAIQNGGGVRVDVSAGDFTMASAYTLLPFSNTLVTLEMTGQQIIDVLEDALSNTLDDAGSTGSYPYASGLRFNVDASADFGSRVSQVEVNSRVAGDWAAIDTAATYIVATNDFIASGQDGYDTFGVVFDAGDYVDTYTEYAQGMVNYVNQLTKDGQSLSKLPAAEYSTQNYIGRDGCDHGAQADCVDY